MPITPSQEATSHSAAKLESPRKFLKFQLQISERRLLLLLGDSIATLIAVLIGLYIWSVVAGEPFSLRFIIARALWFIILPGLWVFLAAANDFYNLRLTANVRQSFARLVLIELQLVLVYLIIFFLVSPDTPLPRLFILYYAMLSFVLIGVWRLWRPFLIGWSGSRRRALILGIGATASEMRHTIEREALGDYDVLGYIASSEDEFPAQLDGLSVLGTGADLPTIVGKLNVSELIVAYDHQLPADVFQGVISCYELGVTIAPMPILYEKITGRVPIEHVGHHWTIVLPLEGRSLAYNLYGMMKRIMDEALALLGLFGFAVVLIPLAIVMRIDSPGPIFYVQERVGRSGRRFNVIKLRSMIPDAERNTGPKWATANDPRITRVGRILRKTRLDEVPQLINVLRGDMSIVGPRPERPNFVDELSETIPFYRTRLVVKPGLTGWAQINYKYGNTAEDALIKLQYDLYYVRHRSLMLDLLIIFRTIGKILSLGGT